MTDIVLKDIDPILADRIRRVSEARGWDVHHTLMNLLEQGLFVCEAEVRGGFKNFPGYRERGGHFPTCRFKGFGTQGAKRPRAAA